MDRATVTIVGGGISGLACAYWLGELMPGLIINLLERASCVGGKIRTRKVGDFTLEAGPDSFVCHGPVMLDFCRRLGLESSLVSTRAGRLAYMWDGDLLEKLPVGLHMGLPSHPWMALLSPSLSPKGRLRAALAGLVPVPAVTDRVLGKFIQHRLDSDSDKELASPLGTGIFSTDPQESTVSVSFPHLAVYKEVADARSEDATFRTFRGGMQLLVDRLAGAIKVNLHTGLEVQRLQRGVDDGWELTTQDGQTWHSREVVLALPSLETARILGSLDEPLAARLSSLGAVSGACVYLGFAEPPPGLPADGYGFVSKDLASRPVVACTWTEPQEGVGVLVRAFLRSSADFSVDDASEVELTEKTLQFLRPLLGSSQQPSMNWLERYPHAFPEYRVGDFPRVAELEAGRQQYPGLHWAGPAFGASGIPNCLQQGRRIAESISHGATA